MRKNLSNLSKTNFRQSILSAPNQFIDGLKLAKNILPDRNFNKIVISGMGGSALPGNLLSTYWNNDLTKNKNDDTISIHQNRFYKLPPESFNNCLNIICSYSGNTEETISSFQESLNDNLTTIAISSGGKIEDMAKKNNIPHIKLPKPSDDFQPRMATGYFLFAIIQILINSNKLPDLTKEIGVSAKKFASTLPLLEKKGIDLANNLINKTPIVYSSTKFKSLSMIWKIKFNETTKIPAFYNVFPELNHNEFIGFTHPQDNYFIIMLRNQSGNKKNLKRYDLTADFLKDRGIKVEIIDILPGDIFFQMFSTIALGDWTSYYLALKYNTDPNAVTMIEKFKKELNKK
jgi:glucose/mannose-6-phosphate isomerase